MPSTELKQEAVNLEQAGRYKAISVPKGTRRIIICDSCKEIVGMDQGRPVDLPIIDLSIRAHVNTTKIARHVIEEVDTRDGTNLPYKRNRRLSVSQ